MPIEAQPSCGVGALASRRSESCSVEGRSRALLHSRLCIATGERVDVKRTRVPQVATDGLLHTHRNVRVQPVAASADGVDGCGVRVHSSPWVECDGHQLVSTLGHGQAHLGRRRSRSSGPPVGVRSSRGAVRCQPSRRAGPGGAYPRRLPRAISTATTAAIVSTTGMTSSATTANVSVAEVMCPVSCRSGGRWTAFHQPAVAGIWDECSRHAARTAAAASRGAAAGLSWMGVVRNRQSLQPGRGQAARCGSSSREF